MFIELKLGDTTITNHIDLPELKSTTVWKDKQLYLNENLIGALHIVTISTPDDPEMGIYYFDSIMGDTMEIGTIYTELPIIQNITLKRIQKDLLRDLKEELAMLLLFTPK